MVQIQSLIDDWQKTSSQVSDLQFGNLALPRPLCFSLRVHARLCVCVCVCVCARAYVRACVRAYVRMCVCVCACACVCVYVRTTLLAIHHTGLSNKCAHRSPPPPLPPRSVWTGEPETHPTNYPFITRFKNWGGYPFDYPCGSEKRVRLICILATGDLRLLASRPELFANKFYWDFSRTALDCLAERLYNRTRDEYLGKTTFDVSYYSSLSFVKDKVINPDFVRTS